MYVLIVVSMLSGGYVSGRAVAMQEFTTKERCEAARKVIISNPNTTGVCLEK